MGGYIGATAVGLTTTAADVQGDITSTDTTPEVILKNTTETDADGTRSGKITFKGEQSGGEESVLAQIQGSHDGASDDEKGDLIFKTNDGNDALAPTERLRINSAGDVLVSSPDPSLTITNTTEEDSDGGRESTIVFQGEQSGGELSTLAEIEASHDGTADDQKGDLIFKTNDGNDGASPTERLRIDSDGKSTFKDDVGIEGATPTLQMYDTTVTNNVMDVSYDEFLTLDIDPNNARGNSGLIVKADGTERVRIDDAGRVMIGTTTEGAANEAEDLTISSTGQVGITIRSTDSGGGRIYFSDGTSGTPEYAGYQIYNHSSNAMIFGTNATERMRITSAGDVGIGSTGSTSYKFIVLASGNQITQLNYASNASFSQDVVSYDTLRANTGSFNFWRCRSNVGASVDNEFIFTGDGSAYADGSFNGGGADYAEYFEWKDGNSDNEDRVGITVKLDGNKIVAATSDDNASLIIGAISANPTVVGDTAWNKWQDKYETDDYGRYVREEYTVTEWTIPEVKDDEGNITSEEIKHSYQTDLIPSNLTAPDNATVISQDDDGSKLTRRKLNSSFDDSVTYVSREKRSEWDTVGMMGKLRIRKGQPTGDRWIKMRDVSDTVEEWLIR